MAPTPRLSGLSTVLLLILLHFGAAIPLLAQNFPTSFTDRTDLLATDNRSGVCMGIADMNGDGRDDIVRFNEGETLNIEYQRSPRAHFGHTTVGTIAAESQWAAAIADVDNDGLNDILVGGAYDNVKLIYNEEDDFRVTEIPNSVAFIQGTNFADINNDGFVDIFSCNDVGTNRAYVNVGNGNFAYDINLINTETNPVSDNSGNYASMWTDYDNDGDQDLYISKCRIGVDSYTDPRRVNQLFANDGNNNFTEVTQRAGLGIGAQTWSADFADIDNDGDMDVFIANHYDDCELYINNGNGTFTDITPISGFPAFLSKSNEVFAIQSLFRDFNNDGFVDLLFVGSEHMLFYNNGDRNFSLASNPFNDAQIESVAIGDLDHNGYLDVYAGYADFFTIPSTTPDDLFLNNGNGNNFIAIQLEGITSNINGIGARVEIHGDWGIQIRDVRSGEGYGIMNTFTQHFGLGQANSIDKIVVKWPSGTVQEVRNTSINQFIQIEEEVACNGQACDDGNNCTINDTYDNNCNCIGTLLDQDADGVCDDDDRCPGFDDRLIGSPCDDGNSCTIGENWDGNCGCSGGILQDTDNDGYCDAEDPAPSDPCIPDGSSTACNSVSQDCDLYNFTGFENNDLGQWIDGGSYARLLFDQTFAPDGSYSFYLQSNTGIASSIYTNQLPLNNVGTLRLKMTIYPYDLEPGDGFVVEASNNGTDYTLIKSYTVGTNLQNLRIDTEEVDLSANVYGNESRLRLRSISNEETDYLILDNISIEFCATSTEPCVAGQPCNDGDPCTFGETFDQNCNCTGGTIQDTDGDGICNSEDNCPNLNDTLIGQSCNDGDACTTGERWDTNCNCSGGAYQDADGDGYCVGEDPNDNDSCIPDASDCSDEPSCETIDFTGFEDAASDIWIDGGSSARFLNSADFANSGVYSFYVQGNEGINSSLYTRALDFRNYQEVLLTFNLLTYQVENGDQFVVEISTNNFNYSVYATATVGNELRDNANHAVELEISGIQFSDQTSIRLRSIADSDADYFIMDDILLEGCSTAIVNACTIGASCDDGEPCTVGSTYDSNCNCTGGTVQDQDADSICDALDTCPNFNNNLIGSACNDGDICTIGETWDNNCGCSGGIYQDADNDGYCAAYDSDDNNPCVPDPNNPNCTNIVGPTGDDCTALHTADFEGAEMDIWIDGGNSARLFSSNQYANSGTFAFYIQGNDGVGSSLYSTILDLSTYNSVELNFHFYAYSMEGADRFHIEVSNNGQAYQILRTLTTGVDFTTDNKVNASLDIPGNYISASTAFRFRAETDDQTDYLILDDIIVKGCGNSGNPTGPSCNMGTPCNDGDPCTINEVYDTACNCVNGIYTDSDGDGYCAGEDADDTDACIPDDSDCTPNGTLLCNTFLDSENFDDNDSGIWNDGGNLATILKSNTFANSGLYLFYVQGNSGAGSSLFSDQLPLANYSAVELGFNFLPYSMEQGDEFVIEVALDGVNYVTYKTYKENIDFYNEQRQDETLIISGLNLTDQTRLRFRSVGDGNSDYLMLDDITLQGCELVQLHGGTEISNRAVNETENQITLFPNPVVDLIQIEQSNYREKTTVEVYDLQGRKVLQKNLKAQSVNSMDVSTLASGQIYMFRISAEMSQASDTFKVYKQ